MVQLNRPEISWSNPMRWRWPHKIIEGLDLGYTGWSPGVNVPPIHLENGFDALVMDGGWTDEDLVLQLTDVIEPQGKGRGESTVTVDANMRVVIFKNFRFHGTWGSIISLGTSSVHAKEPKPLWVEFHNCEFTTDDGQVKQGISGNMAGVRFYNCRIGAGGFRSYEHFAYLRGQVYGPGGCTIHIEDCLLDPDECSEIIKGPTRVTEYMGNDQKHGTMDGMWPMRGPNGERPLVLIENSVLHRKERSSMEGGVVVMQDADKRVLVRNSVLVCNNGGHAVACDAISEGVGPDGTTLGTEPGGHPGNGPYVIEDSTLIVRPPAGKYRSVLRFNSAEAVAIVRSGVYVVSTNDNFGRQSEAKAIIETGRFGNVPSLVERVGVNTEASHAIALEVAERFGLMRDSDENGQPAMLVEPDWIGDPWDESAEALG